MLPELGHFALLLALCLALAQGTLPLFGASRGSASWMALARPAACGQLVFVAFAFALLTRAFLNDDFSVQIVALHSNTALPTMYKVAAVWANHEGSLLLWILLLSAWSVAVAALSRSLPQRFAARVLGVMGLISVGFLLFTLFTSNPFDRLIPAAVEGRDLNPLLQDPALAIHPPILYMGYVGFSVAFAFAVAALLEGRMDASWARWTRPWTAAAWMFLTVGIALGSWWAYYELGWGGWWFWDPVENASFMPWLVGTALLHSLAVTEKRGLFKSWTLLLAVFAFSLSLLGTFLVRSGVLNSVHAFATDPARGVFILIFLGLVVGASLLLYAWRAPGLRDDSRFALWSRETFLLLNNLLLSVAAGLILYGTLYPLFIDALGLPQVSVGAPWFSVAFMIPMLPLLALIGIGMHVAWRSGSVPQVVRRLRWPLLVAAAAGVVIPLVVFGGASVLSTIGVIAACWVMLSSVSAPLARWRRTGRLRGMSRGVWAMLVAHFGVGVFVLGVTVTSTYSVDLDAGMRPGEQLSLNGYDFEFVGVAPVNGPNYAAQRGEFVVRRDGREVTRLLPEKRVYRVQRNPMTEAGIDPALGRDLYVALGEDIGAGAWSVRLQVKPLVRAIWLGTLIMALGGLLALSDRRYRAPVAQRQAPPEGGLAPAGG